MATKIELINPKKNKSIKQIIIDDNYKNAQALCDQKNKEIKNDCFWTVTTINV